MNDRWKISDELIEIMNVSTIQEIVNDMLDYNQGNIQDLDAKESEEFLNLLNRLNDRIARG